MAAVLADTNVLFPFSIMDLLLALSEDRLHTSLWTDALLDEWEDVIVREQQRTPDTAASLTAAVKEFFAADKIERAEYEHLISAMPGKDPDDHEHMAAAVARQPCTLLTNNRDDFPSKHLRQRGVRVLDPDAYLCELIDEWPDEVIATVVRVAQEKRHPPRTSADQLGLLERAGVPKFTAKVRRALAAGDPAP